MYQAILRTSLSAGRHGVLSGVLPELYLRVEFHGEAALSLLEERALTNNSCSN